MIDPLQIHDEPVVESELPAPYRAAFAEAHELLSGDAPAWRGAGHGRHLMLADEVTFFPRPSQVGLLITIGAITLLVLGLAMLAAAMVLVVQQGLAGLSSALVPGVMGLMMIAGGVVLLTLPRRLAARRLRSGEGLFLFPETLVIRRRPAGCQLYPRARIKLDLWQGFGGAGSSSQMGGSSSRRVRLQWTREDRKQGERLLADWSVSGAWDEELYTVLKAWRR